MPGLNAIPSSRRPDMDDIWLVMEQRAEPMAAEIADHVHVLGFHEGLDCGPDVAGGATWPDRRNAAKTAPCHVGPYWSSDGRSWPIGEGSCRRQTSPVTEVLRPFARTSPRIARLDMTDNWRVLTAYEVLSQLPADPDDAMSVVAIVMKSIKKASRPRLQRWRAITANDIMSILPSDTKDARGGFRHCHGRDRENLPSLCAH
jgi:hypothetical protein